MNRLPQIPHSCGFSPLWIRRWVLRLEDVEKALEQTSQEWGRSPVWVLRCRLSKEGRSKHLPQNSHGSIRFLLLPGVASRAAGCVSKGAVGGFEGRGDDLDLGAVCPPKVPVIVVILVLEPSLTTAAPEAAASSSVEETPESLDTEPLSSRTLEVEVGEGSSGGPSSSSGAKGGSTNGAERSRGISGGKDVTSGSEGAGNNDDLMGNDLTGNQ